LNILNKDIQKLLFSGSMLTFAGLVSGALGYLYQILMGRLLGPEDFSTVATITSIFLICASPLAAITLIFARQASSNIATGEGGLVSGMFLTWVGKTIRITALLAVVSFSLLLAADQFFHEQLLFFGCIIIVLLVTAAFFHLTTGYFQGCLQFRTMAALGVSQITLKLLLSTIFIISGFGVAGALGGLVLSAVAIQTVCLLVIYAQTKTASARLNTGSETVRGSPGRAALILEFMPVVAASLAITLFTQLDVIVAKIVFPADKAGEYTAASILAKTLLYLPSGFVQSMYPLIARKYSVNQSDRPIITATLLLVLVPSILTCLMFFLFSFELVDLFFGSTYAGTGEILRTLPIAFLPLAMIIVLEHFLIAKGRVLYAYIFIALAPLKVFIAQSYVNDADDLVLLVGAFGLVLLAVGVLGSGDFLKRRRKPQGN
jgi:O-antigen/teichoic acid export membrane protein